MAKRKNNKKAKPRGIKKKLIPVPMEFNPALEKFEPKVPFNPADHTSYPQNPPKSNKKNNAGWIIAIIILLILIATFFFYIFRSPQINPPNIPEIILSLIQN